jgi:hypothetical protein
MGSDASKPRDEIIDTDDLFGKLDQLISRHQGRGGVHPHAGTVPVLTEAVDAQPAAFELQIPVLTDVVAELDAAREGSSFAGLSESSRRQLQIALYLRLRQRLDQELASEAFAFVPPSQLARIAQALRGALSEVVRDSVEQIVAAPDKRWRE